MPGEKAQPASSKAPRLRRGARVVNEYDVSGRLCDTGLGAVALLKWRDNNKDAT